MSSSRQFEDESSSPSWLNADLRFLCKLHGSVFPKALMIAIPSAFLSVFLFIMMHEYGLADPHSGASSNPWQAYSYVLGAAIVFRTNQAYSRYWEGATLLLKVRGEWYNAASSLIAFCNGAKEIRSEVITYQHHVIRLISLLYCAGLQQVAFIEDDKMEILDSQGLDQGPLEFLMEGGDRCEIVLQWVQRLVVDSMESGVVNIPAPILSRVFQELSRGIVNVKNVQKIAQIPFPFPYTQVIMWLLMIHSILTPLQAAIAADSYWWSFVMTFVQVLGFWSMNFIASEIEQPFGEDYNDLPIPELLRDMNRSLRTLLMPQTQNYPRFHFPAAHSDLLSTALSRTTFMTGNTALTAGFVKGGSPSNRGSDENIKLVGVSEDLNRFRPTHSKEGRRKRLRTRQGFNLPDMMCLNRSNSAHSMEPSTSSNNFQIDRVAMLASVAVTGYAVGSPEDERDERAEFSGDASHGATNSQSSTVPRESRATSQATDSPAVGNRQSMGSKPSVGSKQSNGCWPTYCQFRRRAESSFDSMTGRGSLLSRQSRQSRQSGQSRQSLRRSGFPVRPLRPSSSVPLPGACSLRQSVIRTPRSQQSQQQLPRLPSAGEDNVFWDLEAEALQVSARSQQLQHEICYIQRERQQTDDEAPLYDFQSEEETPPRRVLGARTRGPSSDSDRRSA